MVNRQALDGKIKEEVVGVQIAAVPAVAGLPFADLRDDAGKLQARWYPDAGILEIQRRGVKTRYRLFCGNASV